MAAIYDRDGNELTDGLQSHSVCDQAIRCAKEMASEMNEEVMLEDDGRWTVWPDGKVTDGWDGEWNGEWNGELDD